MRKTQVPAGSPVLRPLVADEDELVAQVTSRVHGTEKLLDVGFSRARSLLVLLLPEDALAPLQDRLKGAQARLSA